MRPIVFHYGPVIIPAFFFMVMIASLACTAYLYWRAREWKISQVTVLDMSMIFTVAGVIGARIFHILVEYPLYYWEHPTYVFHFWRGGFVSYGAFLGIILSATLYFRSKKLDFWQHADFLTLSCPIIIFFVRVGCLLAGCCYGQPTDFWFHLSFTHPGSDAGSKFPGVALHATQIYDMLNALIIFALLHIIERHRNFKGQIAIAFLMMYAVGRGLIEFLRGDADRGVYFGGTISTAQITGLLIFSVCLVWYFYLRKKYPLARVA